MRITHSGLTAGQTVRVELWDSVGVRATALRTWDHTVAEDGTYSIALDPNADLKPEDTYYKVIEDFGGTPTNKFVRVPRRIGSADVDDILIDDGSQGGAFVRIGAPGLADVDIVLGAVTDDGTEQTITEDITDPDVPRSLTATAGGTAADIKAIQVTVHGTNEDDEVISETLPAFTVNTAGSVSGSKVFKTVTSVVIPAHDATGATTSVGTGAKLGIGRKLADVDQVFLATLGTAIVTPTVTADADDVEGNSVDISSGTYDGTKVAKVVLL